MPNLTGYAPLDVAIGLAFVYLLFSVLCSSAQEGIATVLDWRAKTLEKGLRNLLEDDGNADEGGAEKAVPAVAAAGTPAAGPKLADQFLGHGLIRTLYKERIIPVGRRRRGPSYLSPNLFALALLDTIAPDGKAHDPIAEVIGDLHAANLPEGTRQALLALAKNAGRDRDLFRKQLEDWFNGAMERVSGWYRRKAQIVICVLSLIVAVGLNVNTISIGERLAKDGAVRAAVVSLAEKTNVKQGTTGKEAAKTAASEVGKVQRLGIPLGWDKKKGDPAVVKWDSVGDWARNLGGWALTFLALSLGAPFWFGLLGKLSSLRSSGGDPTPPKK